MLRCTFHGIFIAINAFTAGFAHGVGDNNASLAYGAMALMWLAVSIIHHAGIRAAVAKVSPWK